MKMYHQIDIDTLKVNSVKHNTIHNQKIIHIVQNDYSKLTFQSPILYNLNDIKRCDIKNGYNSSSLNNILLDIDNKEFENWLIKLNNKIMSLIKNVLLEISENYYWISTPITLEKIEFNTKNLIENDIIYNNCLKDFINCKNTSNINLYDINRTLINKNKNIKKDNRCIFTIDLSLININSFNANRIEYYLICTKGIILPEIPNKFDFNITDDENIKKEFEVPSLKKLAEKRLSKEDKEITNELVMNY
jgi:hypothetical protein